MRPPSSTYSLCAYTDGSRFFCAKLVIWPRFENANRIPGRQYQRLRALVRDGREGAIEVLGAGHLNGLELQAQRTCRLLHFLVVEQIAPDVGISEHRHAGERGRLPSAAPAVSR